MENNFQREIEEFERKRRINSEQWLESLRGAKRCDWCGCDDALNRRSLCAFCERIWKKLEKAHKESGSDMRKEIRIKRAEAEKKNCIKYGTILKALLASPPSGLKVEHLLTDLGEQMTGENLFHGYSSHIDWTFDATQRSILAVLFWMILSRQAQRFRRHFAAKDSLYAAMRQSRPGGTV
jgi:hypothetical protein